MKLEFVLALAKERKASMSENMTKRESDKFGQQAVLLHALSVCTAPADT